MASRVYLAELAKIRKASSDPSGRSRSMLVPVGGEDKVVGAFSRAELVNKCMGSKGPAYQASGSYDQEELAGAKAESSPSSPNSVEAMVTKLMQHAAASDERERGKMMREIENARCIGQKS